MGKLTTNALPSPGSDDATMRGCTCPVIDNSYGQGYLGNPGRFWITAGCPVHAPGHPHALSQKGDEADG